jgi:hypothetical protein
MDAAVTKMKHKEIAKIHGIREPPALAHVGSIDYAKSLPWDWMHLFAENILPNLVSLWTGRFKGLDSGSGNYEFSPEVWTQIGQETADAVKDIPA